MIYLFSIVVVVFIVIFFRKNCLMRKLRQKNRMGNKNIVKLDVREYNEPRLSIEDLIQIPSAYLQRYYHEIPNEELHVIASSRMQLNHSLCFLLKKRYQVSSCEVIDYSYDN